MVNTLTGEITIPARDRYVAPPVRSDEWIAEFRQAAELCESMLWELAQSGHFVDAEELYTVAKAHKIAKELTHLAHERLSQVGYGV